MAPSCLFVPPDMLQHQGLVLCSYGCPRGAGTILLVAAEHISMLYIGRVLLGFGVGFAIQVSR